MADKRGPRCHGWCFTLFEPASEPVFDSGICRYLIYGRETCPTSGRKHLQGYIYFRERQRFSAVKKIFPTAHLEASKGSPQHNKDYCSKDGDFTEYGDLPASKSGGGAFADCLSKAEEGDIAAIKAEYPGIYLRYKANIHSSVKFRTTELSNSCGVWICGPPRCGKDFSVRQLGDVYCKPLNKWWDGYAGEKFILLSDVEPDHKWLGYFLKIWCDRYPFIAEIKGASMKIRPEKIFVTSNFVMSDVFSGQILEALQCRFNVYNEFDGSVNLRKDVVPSTSVLDKLRQFEDGLQATQTCESLPSTSQTNDQENKDPSSSEEFQEPKKKGKFAKSPRRLQETKQPLREVVRN